MKGNMVMNLLHVCIFFRNPMFSGLINNQFSHGIDLRVLYYETRKIGLKCFKESYVDSLPSNVWYLPSPVLRMQRLKIVYKKALDTYGDFTRYDLIHAHTLCQDGYLAKRINKEFGIPYVLTVRNCDFARGNLWGLAYRKKLYLEILDNASKVSFLSVSAQRLLESLIKDKEKIEQLRKKSYIIPNGIDDYWHQNKLTKAKEKPEGHIRFLTVGRIEKNKNQVFVAKALKKFEDKHKTQIKYTVVGKKTDKEYAAQLDVFDFVEYKEFCDKQELIRLYQNSDIYILMSHSESFGLSYVEAMTQGLPLVYTKGQGFDGQFQEGEVGFSANDDDEDDVVDAVDRIMERFKEISEKCIAESTTFSWENSERKYYDMYMETLEKSEFVRSDSRGRCGNNHETK